MRHWIAMLSLCGCGAGEAIVVPSLDEAPAEPPTSGWTDTAWETTVPEETTTLEDTYEGAWARIISPKSSSYLSWGEQQHFEVELLSRDGEPLEPESVTWQSSIDVDFHGETLAFNTDTLVVGNHEITAIVELPTGDSVSHSVGGVVVQSPYAGVYSGLFSMDGTVTQVIVTCTGSAQVDVGPLGEYADGDAHCLVSLLGIDIPMNWVFDLENQGGVITGTGGVELVGIFTYDIPVTEGSVDPATGVMKVDFSGNIPFIGSLNGYLDLDLLTRDAGL